LDLSDGVCCRGCDLQVLSQTGLLKSLFTGERDRLQLGYRFLEHATDAIIEVEAPTLEEAFTVAGNAVVDTTLNPDAVNEAETREFSAEGKDLRYLLFSWLEEVIYLLITDGFAIKKLEPKITRSENMKIACKATGEPIDLSKHGFKVEIKAPTFHDMEIRQNGGVYMRFLLDL